MDRYIGRLLDNRYEILEIIGVGGMAVVYKARDHRLKRLVAIKILKDEYAQDEEFRRRFNAESQAVAMLSHPNIVSVYDVSESEGMNYIVMELIDGITLKQYMDRRGILNWREILHFSLQITKALEHAHGRGIIHRDIKPHNIMILKDGSVKVADFGIARMASSQNTLTREALGSVHYISPEQAKGGRTDCRSDLYSLGVVMYEMMTARTPFDGDTPVAVAIQHINGKAKMPHEINPDVPRGLEQIAMHAMTADVRGRYPNATAMLADLEEFRKDPSIQFHFTPVTVPKANSATQVIQGKNGVSQALKAEQAKQSRRKSVTTGAKPEPDPDREEKSGGGRIVAIVLACVAAVLLIGYLIFGLLIPKLKGAGQYTCPNFIGQSTEDIHPSDYPYIEFEVTAVYDDEPYGTILEQDPAADTVIEKGTVVKLTASRGPKAVDSKMPNLVGLTVNEAEEALEQLNLGLTVYLKYEANSDFDKGLIINSDPVYNVTLTEEQDVTLTISLGAEEEETETAEVPKLVGENISDAVTMISDAGFIVGNITEVEDSSEVGTVISQSVKPEQTAEKGTKISLTISKGEAAEEEEPEQQETEQETTQEPETTETETTQDDKTYTERVTVYLPSSDDPEETIKVQTYMNGTLISSDDDIALGIGYLVVTVTGSGTQKLDIYFNGEYAYSQSVVFGG